MTTQCKLTHQIKNMVFYPSLWGCMYLTIMVACNHKIVTEDFICGSVVFSELSSHWGSALFVLNVIGSSMLHNIPCSTCSLLLHFYYYLLYKHKKSYDIKNRSWSWMYCRCYNLFSVSIYHKFCNMFRKKPLWTCILKNIMMVLFRIRITICNQPIKWHSSSCSCMCMFILYWYNSDSVNLLCM